jgi:uncharacterized 2Fe-2S/4Fe-4S cluster protein (DUF4445 family)
MAEHKVTFQTTGTAVALPTGSLLTEAARLAGIELNQPCGGQGRCGRCAVQIVNGDVRQRSQLRLSSEDIAQGYTLACQSVIEGDVTICVPPQEQLERRLTTDRTVAKVALPAGYDPAVSQAVRRLRLDIAPPSMDDQTDDWGRLQRALRQTAGIVAPQISLTLLRKLGRILRQEQGRVTAVVDTRPGERPNGGPQTPILIDLLPGHGSEHIHGLAIDIGTTTVTVWLVDLLTGEVLAQASEYNRQIQRGEDVISRIIYAGKNGGEGEMQALVLTTINALIDRVCQKSTVSGAARLIVKATMTGNSVMMHLLLGIPADSIRLSPFVTAVNHPPLLTAAEVGLRIHPAALVDCLPGVASYVGADISAGALASGLDSSDQVSLFLDVGTNGETVLGSREWQVACACSAGPAFEGAGVLHGMRATRGAIEEVWINDLTYEPAYRVIGDGKPSGLCGSGLISLLAEMFLTGILDKKGNINLTLDTPRARQGDQGPEYVIAWGAETQAGKEIVITRVDIDNLLRAKAAIYAGFTVLAQSIGFPLETVSRALIGGSFGQYINVEKAVQIGLLPDLPWEQFYFLGNTSVLGAYLALIDYRARERISQIASGMTYVELSADNTFYEAFTSALFLPHTDLHRFPSVAAALNAQEATHAAACQ